MAELVLTVPALNTLSKMVRYSGDGSMFAAIPMERRERSAASLLSPAGTGTHSRFLTTGCQWLCLAVLHLGLGWKSEMRH